MQERAVTGQRAPQYSTVRLAGRPWQRPEAQRVFASKALISKRLGYLGLFFCDRMGAVALLLTLFSVERTTALEWRNSAIWTTAAAQSGPRSFAK